MACHVSNHYDEFLWNLKFQQQVSLVTLCMDMAWASDQICYPCNLISAVQGLGPRSVDRRPDSDYLLWCSLVKSNVAALWLEISIGSPCFFVTKDTWAPFQYHIKRLICEVSKLWEFYLRLSDRLEIWQTPRQHCYRCVCQIPMWYNNLNSRLRNFTKYHD